MMDWHTGGRRNHGHIDTAGDWSLDTLDIHLVNTTTSGGQGNWLKTSLDEDAL